MLRQYPEALPPLREGISRAPNLRFGHFALASTYAQLGQLENTRAEVAEVLRIEPTYTIERHRRLAPLKNPEDVDHFFEGGRKAGLPER